MVGDTAQPLFGGIEAGGTKFVLAVGEAPSAIRARHVLPTTTPDETLGAAAQWLAEHGRLAALGIASFGPVELDRRSPRWGTITDTTKPGWADCPIVGRLAGALDCPVGFETDVNGAAIAEYALGADGKDRSLAYVTVGTGIGGGLVVDGRCIGGAGHPEMGHIFPRRPAGESDFPGICPHHGDCLEGVASGPAIMARWGARLSDLPADHVAHDYVADYLAQLCHTIFASVAAETIVLGGGVMQTPGLLDKVRQRTKILGSNYLPGRARQQVIAPRLGQDSGICGALLLARQAFEGAS